MTNGYLIELIRQPQQSVHGSKFITQTRVKNKYKKKWCVNGVSTFDCSIRCYDFPIVFDMQQNQNPISFSIQTNGIRFVLLNYLK
jgi:hypothetical protein